MTILKRIRDASNKLAGLSWVLAGAGVRALGQWGLIWLIARWQGPEEVGRYGLAQAWIVPITSFFSFQLIRFQATDHAQEFNFRDYLAFRYAACIGAAIVVGIALAFLPHDIRILAILLALQLLVISVAGVYQGRVLQAGSSLAYGQSLFVFNVAVSGVAALALALCRNLELALGISALSGAATILAFLVPAVRRVDRSYESKPDLLWPHWNAASQRQLLSATFPLALWLFVNSATTQIPRVSLEASTGQYELGILVGLLMFLSLGSLVNDALAQAATPRITALISSDQRDRLIILLRRTHMLALLGLTLITPAAYWFGPYVVRLVLGSQFGEYPHALVAVAIALCIQFVEGFLVVTLNAIRKIRIMLHINIACPILATLCAVLVVPAFGVSGAAYTVAAVYALRWLLMVVSLGASFRSP